MKGEITGSEDLAIEGTFEGLVQLDEGKLTIGTTAKVTADVTARVVVVQCEGQCTANDRIEIKKDGSVNGDLTTAQIIIEDGAYFKGSIEIADGMCTDSPGGGRGAEEYLITKECLRSYAQDRDNKWFAEFGCSHLKSGDAGYMFPFVLRCAIILPMHRAKGVRP